MIEVSMGLPVVACYVGPTGTERLTIRELSFAGLQSLFRLVADGPSVGDASSGPPQTPLELWERAMPILLDKCVGLTPPLTDEMTLGQGCDIALAAARCGLPSGGMRAARLRGMLVRAGEEALLAMCATFGALAAAVQADLAASPGELAEAERAGSESVGHWPGWVTAQPGADAGETPTGDKRPPDDAGAGRVSPVGSGMSAEQARAEAERIVKANGNEWPGFNKLVERVGCAKGTMTKAVASSKYLKARKAEHEPDKRPKGRTVPLSHPTADPDAVDPAEAAAANELAKLAAEQAGELRREDRQQRAAAKRPRGSVA